MSLAGVGWAVQIVLTPRNPGVEFPAVPLLVLGVCLGGMWRMYLAGVYVGEAGVLLRYPLRSKVNPWLEVAGARVTQDARYRNEALFLVTPDGSQTRTPLYRFKLSGFSRSQPRSSALGVSADTLQQAADRINELAAAHRGGTPLVWPAQ